MAVEDGSTAGDVALSVVVPAYDEAANLERLAAEVTAALAPTGVAWELLVVDDGSDDESPAVLERLAAGDPRIRFLRQPARSGQTAALAAGFRHARGALIATLDADLQCSPRELPLLLDALGDADLACGIRGARHDPPTRRLASACSNLVRRAIVAPRVRDLACPLRVFRRSALERVEAMTPLFHGAHRWLPALFVLAGLRVVQRPVPHHPRVAGVSKYTTRGRLLPVVRELGRVGGLALARSRTRRIIAVVLLLALAAIPFLVQLGRWPLAEPDEGRNAEVAREMLAFGSWAVPRFNQLPYLDKPVLLFWMIAAAFRVIGVGELGARLPSALSAVASVGLTFAIARPLVGVPRALLAAVIFATMPLVVAFARLAIFDMPLTALVTGALCCLLYARLDGHRARWLPLAGALMGLATLMKGPVGIAVPLLAWFAARGALPPARERGVRPVLAAAVITLVIVVAWLARVEAQEPGFLRYAIFDETFLRFTSPQRFHRGGPPWFYLLVLAWAPGAWTLALAAVVPGLVRRWRGGDADAPAIAFAARALAAIVVFFTCSASKRAQYILPAMVPLALLLAIGIAAEQRRFTVLLRGAARWVAVAGVGALAASVAGATATGGDFRVVTPPLLLAVGTFLLAWGVVTARTAGRTAVAVAACVLFTPLLGMALLRPLDPYAESRSSRTIARMIEPDARVVCFEAFRTGLPFYLGRPVLLFSRNGRELTSNYIEARAERLIGNESFAPLMGLVAAVDEPPPVYVLASPWRLHRLKQISPRRLVPVYADRRNVLLRPEG